jgi:type IV pilus assembly protein PilQ
MDTSSSTIKNTVDFTTNLLRRINSGKVLIMRSPTTKYKGLKFLAVLAFVIAVCAAVAAEDGIKDSNTVSITLTDADSNSITYEEPNEALTAVTATEVNSIANRKPTEVLTTVTTPEANSIANRKPTEVLTTVTTAEVNSIASGDSNEIPLEQRMQKTISVDFINTPIEDVIKMIAEQADVDIIKSPTVTGNVTAKLTNVPLGEALDNILAVHNYGRVINKNMIRVAPLDEIAQKEEILETRVYQITYADVGEVESALKKFISKRGSLSSSPGTSNIIIKDSESNIKAMDEFVAKIDRVTPQILVEVRIYDITSTDGFNIDANWMAGLNNTTKTIAGAAATDLTDVVDDDDYYTYRRTRPYVGGEFAPSSTGGGTITIGFLDTFSAEIALNVLRSEVGAKLLANPRLLVLDNETAQFEIIRQVPYTEVSTTGAGTDTQTVKFKDIGTMLKVTPHVTRDGMIRLNINPEFGVQVGETTPPTVDTRKMNTKALVKDGQTVVLGGLRKREVSQEVHKIAILGDIPILGGLFSGVDETLTTSEIIIFITPRIVVEPTLSPHESKSLGATDFSDPRTTYTIEEKLEKTAK